ncbi:YqhV family protein [Desertibacillus haloalkaliphilus]|uniref:YqhV family protein n=1 Tax=Desertibacillus haloalkaliphilus TaxID=1328930 RepID=UPI001C26983D|nr:YqhV family protein [Desertibacillus haloalkaliphilus]MBU8907720.1 YqhV family protein [Desertibacillus haloalkaliphilus]
MKAWLTGLETALIGMVIIRLISGFIELSAAALMFKFNSVEKAVAINALLAIVGPLVLITTMTIGLVGMSDKLSLSKLLMIGSGVLLILIGLRR